MRHPYLRIFAGIISLFGSPAIQADDLPLAPAEAASTTVITIDLTDPTACQKLLELLKANKVEIADPTLAVWITGPACQPSAIEPKDTGSPKTQTIVVVKPDLPAAVDNPMNASLELNGALAHGNDKYAQIKGAFAFDKRWNNLHVIATEISGDYRSDT